MKGTFKQLFLLAFMALSVVISGCDKHEYVDLGLPSGTKWATCNIGAEKPEDYGDYYAWGEISTKTEYSWYTYAWGTIDGITKYNETDGLTKLESADDAATACWGDKWRMPTKDEMCELEDNCTWEWTTQNNVQGYLVTGPNGNSIFLPAAGNRHGFEPYDVGTHAYYWSSSSCTDSGYARHMYFYSSFIAISSPELCYYGLSVRAVRK